MINERFKVTPQSDLTTSEMLEKYSLEDETILMRWAQYHVIESNRGYYNPDAVDLIDHVHHHIYNLGMSIIDYQIFIARSQIKPQNLANKDDKNMTENSMYKNVQYSQESSQGAKKIVYQGSEEVDDALEPEQVNQEAYTAIDMLKQQYSEAIDVMGERIADHFIDELDLSVMRHLVKKVKERQKLNGKVASNCFKKTIKAVLQPHNGILQPHNGNFLVLQDQEDEPSIELEQNHRLG